MKIYSVILYILQLTCFVYQNIILIVIEKYMFMKKILIDFTHFVSNKLLINPNQTYMCAISGGQDSVLLFIVLLHLKKQFNINIQLVHFQHFWQPKNFFFSQHIWKLAFTFNHPLYIVFSERILEKEKKAREWRQQGLQRVSTIEKSTTILTGHTASDRVETSFWHLIRGTSIQGLLSLKSQKNLKPEIDFFNCPFFTSTKSKFLKKNKQFFPVTLHFHSVNRKTSFSREKKKQGKKKLIYFKTKNKKKISFYLILPCHFFTTDKLVFFYKTINQKNFLQHKKLFNYYKKKNFYSLFLFSPLMVLNWRQNSFIIMQNKILLNDKTRSTLVFFDVFFSKKYISRPLLIFHRNDIMGFSKNELLPIVLDPSNKKIYWSRNRIRHQLFPILRFFFNPNTEYVINNFLEISFEEQNYIEYLVEKIIYYWIEKASNFSSLENQIEKLPISLQKRILQKVIQSYTKLQYNLGQVEIIRMNIDTKME